MTYDDLGHHARTCSCSFVAWKIIKGSLNYCMTQKLPFVIDKMHLSADLAVGGPRAAFWKVLVDHESHTSITKNTQFQKCHNWKSHENQNGNKNQTFWAQSGVHVLILGVLIWGGACSRGSSCGSTSDSATNIVGGSSSSSGGSRTSRSTVVVLANSSSSSSSSSSCSSWSCSSSSSSSSISSNSSCGISWYEC